MSQFLPPEGTPPPADEPTPFDPRGAATALIQWANAQGIKRSELLECMTIVCGKIIADTTRPDAFEINDALDRYVLRIAHAINDRLYANRAATRLDLKRRFGGPK